jgi:hypothetical protein
MKIAQTKAVGLIGVALLVGTAAVGCGEDDKGSSSSSSSSSTSSSAASTSAAASATSSAAATAAPAGDYSKLLLKASDIDPSFTASPPETPPAGITGIGQTMANPQNQTITFQIVIETDPAAAVKRLEDAKATLSKDVDGAPQPADVGDGGFIATGKSPDGSKAITEVFFTRGKAATSVEFTSAPNDPVLPETALAVAKMQDTQIKNNLT